MPPEKEGRGSLPKLIRRFPADLVAVLVLTLLTILAISLPIFRETPFRIVFGLPLLLFLPGYVFIATLFPENATSSNEHEEGVNGGWRINPVKRIGLAFGMSTVISPLVGLTLSFTPLGIRLIPVVLSMSIFTIGCAIVAAVRRWELPVEERFSIPYRDWIATVRTEVFEPDNRVDAVVSVVLALSIILVLVSIGVTVVFPQQGEQFTEFYLLTEEEDGEFVADDYPVEFIQGETQSMIVGIENNEHETIEYTVVIQLERIEGEGNKTEVIEREELDRFETTLTHNEAKQINHDITLTLEGEELRLTYLLYDGKVPEEPTRSNAYQNLHLWITVEETDIQEPIEISSRETDVQASNQTSPNKKRPITW